MATLKQPHMTMAADLYTLPSDGHRYELIHGVLQMMSPSGARHGRIAAQLAHLLKTHVDSGQLGIVFAAETGFLIQTEPDTVLAPDVAFVSRANYETIENDTQYIPLAPEFVAEVLSPSDRYGRVEAKALLWLEAGTKLVIVVDPENEPVHAYWSKKRIEVFERTETIDCNDAVASWTLVVDDIFRMPGLGR